MNLLSHHLLAKVPPRKLVTLGLLLWSTLIIGIAVYRGSLHDYVGYQSQWRTIKDGLNPWTGIFVENGEFTGNVYGPLHNLLVYFWVLNPLAPKIFMVVNFLLANSFLVRELLRRNSNYRVYLAYSLIIPLNYLVIGNVGSFGLNDSWVSALIVFAVVAKLNNKSYLAGFFLTLSILLKYYPAFIFLFFLIDKKKFDIKLLIATSVMSGIGFFLTFLVWGESFLNSVRFGGGRKPKPLSILWALDPVKDKAEKSKILNFLIDNNSILLMISALLIMFMIYKFNLSWTEGSVIGTLIISLLYKGSSIQYFLPLMVLTTLLLFVQSKNSKLLLKWILPFILFMSVYAFGYEATGGYWTVMTQVRPNIGYFSFSFGLITCVGFFMSVKRDNRKNSNV